jgi:hypothetical protein
MTGARASGLFRTRQGDRELEYLVTVLALQVHLDRFGIDVDIFLDDLEKLAT